MLDFPVAISERFPHPGSNQGKITVRQVPVEPNKDHLAQDYRNMWEYDPGEERDRAESDTIFNRFLKDRKDVVAVAAYRPEANGSEKWVGSAIGYKQRRDQPLGKLNQAAIATVFVDEAERLKGAATAMVTELKNAFHQKGYAGIQLYASPEGKEVYKRLGFTDGDEMRYKLALHKPTSSTFSPDNAIDVRLADLTEHSDKTTVLKHERAASGIPQEVTSDDKAAQFFAQTYEAGKGETAKAFLAYTKADGQEKILGSAIAGEWHYPVPNTFTSEGPLKRRDLSVPGLRLAPGVSGITAQSVYLSLIQKLLTHAHESGFTQINVQQAGPARAALENVGFKNGIHMQYSNSEAL
jgi:GNAT superfamily N-acetyltransferase